MFAKIFLMLILASCSSIKKDETVSVPEKNQAPKEFSRGELILGTQLLTKIFDKEMAPLSCVPDTDEASLLLRTIRPRMEVVEDDIEAELDNPSEVDALIKTCDQNCTCDYIDDLLKEHQVNLTKSQIKKMVSKKTDKELNRCLLFVQNTFCDSELYKTLEKEKSDFSFEEGM